MNFPLVRLEDDLRFALGIVPRGGGSKITEVAAGHEIGAHGYSHENPVAMTRQQEEDVLKKSIELIEKFSGKKPRGYVAPWWEMSASTAELLLQNGFRYDHSQGYNDFVPFYARVGDEWTKIDYSKKASEWMRPMKHGKPIDLVEIGANWYVDDLPPMMFIKKAPNSHGFVNPRQNPLYRPGGDSAGLG